MNAFSLQYAMALQQCTKLNLNYFEKKMQNRKQALQ